MKTQSIFSTLCLAMAALAGFASSAPAAELTPGTTVRADGKIVATFSAVGTGTWTIPAGVTEVEVLVVGGGGSGAAGGTWSADGGGAGGLGYIPSYSVTGGSSVTITVGAGGAAITNWGAGNAGSNSVFEQYVAQGGEGGLDSRGGNQGGFSTNSGGSFTAGYLGATHAGSNGGGGAGANGLGNHGACYGGIGVQNSITGPATYYAGGGGGGYSGGDNAGGLGGGGKGATDGENGHGHDALVNTGGGGGASRDNPLSGAGGSGVVIVAYTGGVTMRTVSFDSGAGGSTVSPKMVADGTKTTAPTAPTKTGYTFIEWCTVSPSGSAFDFANTNITADITLYAKWVTDWVVTFNSTGGSAVTAQYVFPGGTATTPTPPTWTGHTFDGWYTEIELTNLFSFSTPITADTTLYAKWVTDWVVTFNSTGGSSVTTQYIFPGATATLPTAPTKTGYTFDGWYEDAGLTPPVFDFGTAIKADRTLYAKWAINSYTLTYNADVNGTIEGTTPQTVQYLGSGIAVLAKANSFYQFLKWSDDVTTNPRTDTSVASNITVTAIFELIPPPFGASISTRADGKTVATFTSGSGTWTIPTGVTSVEVLVIGGGGGGGRKGGGGGGGGFYYTTSHTPTGGSVAITVGNGGLGDSGNNTRTAGGQSVFDGLIAYGGGIGSGTGVTAAGGHSGGNNQGDAGYAGSNGNGDPGAGAGDGAVLPGGWSNLYGGDGKTSTIVDGVNPVYYGGGGGGWYNGGNNNGGQGGGGRGSLTGGAAENGFNGLGGGGGDARDSGSGGAGGSGIVIVAYQLPGGEVTSTELKSSIPSSYLGDSVTFTATVKVGGSVVPSLPGTVQFKVNGVVKEATASIDSVTGEATYTSLELPLGTYDVVATYSGVTGTYMTSSATISQTVSNTPFTIWAAAKGIPEGQAGPTNDPDGDGSNNLSEFAFGGEPLSGSDNGKVFSQFKVRELDANGTELVLTVAVLADTSATFVADGNSLIGTSTAGRITYRIEGSNDLNFSNVQVGQVAAEATTAMNNVLPAGYVYRSFVLAPGGTPAKGFLRAVVVKP